MGRVFGHFFELTELADAWVVSFITSEGRSTYALAVSRTGELTSAQARRASVPVVLAIGGTHAGEIDGKDAGLILIRELLKSPPRGMCLKIKFRVCPRV